VQLWSRADNSDLFRNIAEYLLGYTDLRLVKVSCKKKLKVGRKVAFKILVRNMESDFSRPSEVDVYLSSDRTFDPDEDTYVGTAQIPAIKGGGKKKVKLKARVPAADGGSCYVLAVINPSGAPPEVNPDNNVASKKVNVQ